MKPAWRGEACPIGARCLTRSINRRKITNEFCHNDDDKEIDDNKEIDDDKEFKNDDDDKT